jgi:acetyl esterase
VTLHPQASKFLDRLRQLSEAAPPPPGQPSPEQARASHIASMARVSAPGEEVAEVHELSVPTPQGRVPVRAYRPVRAERSGTLLYMHGGGWVVGTLDTFDGVCRALANRCGMTVLSVDYRLAPEHRYPAAIDDCYAVAEWVASGAGAPLVDGGPLVVAGDSAGGNLAAVLAIRARDRDGPLVAAQVLIYPITDVTMNTVSYREFGEGFYLTAAEMSLFWRRYLGPWQGEVRADFSPLHADELAGLAPAFVLTAEYDPLRDEGEAYARRLEQAGVPVRLLRSDGMIHGFLRFTAICDSAEAAFTAIGDYVKSTVAGDPLSHGRF